MTAVRSYQSGDIAALVTTWNQILVHDPVNQERFAASILCDPNMEAEGFSVIPEAGGIAAFAYASVRRRTFSEEGAAERDVGWINAFGVHPVRRRQGLGAQCMEAAFAYLRLKGCHTIRVGAFVPYYIAPGVDLEAYPAAGEFLLALGFQRESELVSMQASLLHFTVPPDVETVQSRLLEAGVQFEALTADFLLDLLNFIRRNFQADAAQVIQNALRNGGRMSQIFIARENRAVIGYCMYGLYDGNLERFGPFGVRADQRRRNVGKVLLYRCMEAMQAQGLRTVWFKSASEASPAAQLYRRAGFQTVRRFHTFSKPL